MAAVLWLVVGALLVGCQAFNAAPASSAALMPVRYVALGDSYTIGTSVSPAESWPSQLTGALPDRLDLVANLGVNGYSTDDLIRDELPALDRYEPGFVTVMIGVNDVVRGVPEAMYEANVVDMLDTLLARLPATRIVAVATPDYTVTPMGASFGNPAQQSAAIKDFNAVFQAAAERRGIRFVPEIFGISQAVATDQSLVAPDGLHPSGGQYARWVEVIQPVVESLLAAP